MSRFDVLKSLVRSAARAGGDRLAKVGRVEDFRKVLSELRGRRIAISEAMLTRAINHGVRGVEAATVSLRDERARFHLDYGDGEPLGFALVPDEARFAPRGAKEVIFAVEPPELVSDARVREVVGAVAAGIARALWGPMMGPPVDGEEAFVEREGARLRADLRSVPAVRALLEGSPLAMALEVLAIEGFVIEDRALRIVIALPMPG